MAVTVANLALAVVDKQLRPLMLRDSPRSINGLGLRVVKRCEALVTFASNTPLTVMWYYMLVLAHGTEPPV